MRRTVIALLGLLLVGCSSAGPFVTNISSDGKGTVLVERGTLRYNSFTGTISIRDRQTSMLQVAK